MWSADLAFPAGDESDSSDEWDIGLSEKKPSAKKQREADTAPAEDDPVSLLKRAIYKGDVETMEQLLDNGLDVDSRLDYGWTPLIYAVNGGNIELTKMLLDRGASVNFSKDHWTVLMACCTASVPEEKICSCMELLLSKNADPNMMDRSHMSCLMLASRDGYSKVINLLVSHGASVNSQDLNGYTALCYAVQYGREESVLKLLQLGADKNLKTKLGISASDLAMQFKHSQNVFLQCIIKLCVFFSASKLDDLELLFHGFGLGYLADVIIDHDISWSQLLTMDKTDLHKIGITEPKDQQKVLTAVQQMELDRVDLENISELEAANAGSVTEELHRFLISVREQCRDVTEAIQDVVNRFPRRASQLVFSLDPDQEARYACNQLLIQTEELQREVTLLQNLFCQVSQDDDCPNVPELPSKLSWRRVLKGASLSMLGAGALLLWAKGSGVRAHLHQWSRW
ncbi:hypothetical protein NQD34_004072 [Periophthalmus magnuspinnatus]|nr:hypothetical protein NQD34_004072 [Periophthalmus magnuspinnatus]